MSVVGRAAAFTFALGTALLGGCTRMANVHLALLQAAGVPATSFADSNGPVAGLLTA